MNILNCFNSVHLFLFVSDPRIIIMIFSRYVSRPSAEDEWWKDTKEEEEKMEVNGDSSSENCDLPSSSGAGGSTAQSPATDESPSSEISNGPNLQEHKYLVE